MRFTLDVLDSTNDINKKIIKSLLAEVDDWLKSRILNTKNSIRNIIRQSIISAPEYQSLVSGKLKLEFGIPDAASKIQGLLSIWEAAEIDVKKTAIKGNKIVGGFSIYMIQSDFSDVLFLLNPDAYVLTEKGDLLNWLEWLLMLGDKTIVKEYEVEIKPSPRSRTGGAVMKRKKSAKWKVPSEFSGTVNNNWITRSIDSVENDIEMAILRELQK
jgi:hypothetical protein